LRSLVVLDTVDSTQDEVIRRLKAGLHVEAILGYEQKAGRGRFGRSWESPLSESLSLSFAWLEAIDSEWPAGLALAAGVAAAEAFDTDIQWPNDLVINGRKVGGVLSEIVPCSLGKSPVIGLGMNLTQTSAPGGIPWASSLVMAGRPRLAPMEAAVAFLEAMETVPIPKRFEEISGRWRSRDQTLGKKYKLPDGRTALALYVDDDGGLVAKVGGTQISVSSAEAIYGKGS
jgi:BirA family biotin operon repressor/biotin-[acetyl-CoA-carboxylase] ligase